MSRVDERAATASDEAAVEVIDLSAGYRGKAVVRGVSFRIGRGRLAVLVGPNGSGKTTLLKTIACALPSMRGRVLVGGASPASMSPRHRARLVSFVPQTPPAAWPYSAREVVSGGRYAYVGWFGRWSAEDRSAVEAAMEEAGVAHLADRKIHEISGGELRRVYIARALAQRAPVMLLDEPAAHLDPSRQIELMCSLRALTKTGRTVILSIHDVNLAHRFADDAVVILPDGATISGAASEVLSRETLGAAFGTAFVLGHHDEYGSFALPVAWPSDAGGGPGAGLAR